MKVAQSCPNSLRPHGLYHPWNSPGQNLGVGSLSLLQGIFPTKGSNPGVPNCRRSVYQLSHKGSPKILGWVAYPFSSGSSQPRNQPGVYLHWRQILYQLSYQYKLKPEFSRASLKIIKQKDSLQREWERRQGCFQSQSNEIENNRITHSKY